MIPIKVILISGKAQVGKDSTATYLKDKLEQNGKSVLISHYGDLVKYICRTFFEWNGEKDSAGRSLLQFVGTDRIRKKYPDFWVKFVFDVLSVFSNEWDYVLVADCRFKNEINLFKNSDFDTITVRVERLNFESPLTKEQQNHESETNLDDQIFDYYISSESGLDKLHQQIDLVFKGCLY